MKNRRWTKVLVGIVLWCFLAKSTFSDSPGIIGNMLHNIAGLLPHTLLGLSNLMIVFGLFTVLFLVLAYFALFHSETVEAKSTTGNFKK